MPWCMVCRDSGQTMENGASTILMDRGKLYRVNLKKAKLDLEEFLAMCRQQGCFDLTSIQTAIFEFNARRHESVSGAGAAVY